MEDARWTKVQVRTPSRPVRRPGLGGSQDPGLALGVPARACCPPMSSVTSIDSHRHRLQPEPELDQGGESLYGVGDLIAAVDDHTRTLLTRGRLERRGWLVPRALVAADLLGLSLAYVLTTLMWGVAGAFGSFHQILVFLFTLPCWAI